MLIATIHELKGEKDEANRYYQKILDIEKNFAPAANNLAWNYSERGGNLDVALGLAQRAREANSDEPSYADTLGWIYYKKKAYGSALSLLKESSERFKNNNPTVVYHLGMAYWKNGDLLLAKNELARSLLLKSSFPEANDARNALSEVEGLIPNR